MDKTLEAVTLIHRLTLAVALGLFVAAVSVHRPSDVYGEAERELQSLEDAIQELADQTDDAYAAIYDESDLKASTLAWLTQRHIPEVSVVIKHVEPDSLATLDAAQNPQVAVDAQVKWADAVYLGTAGQFYDCSAERQDVFRALNNLFGRSNRSTPTVLAVDVNISQTRPDSTGGAVCQIDFHYESRIGKILSVQHSRIDGQTPAPQVTPSNAAKRKWIDLDRSGTLKGHGLGDPGDGARSLHIPNLRALWSDIGFRTPAAASAFLVEKRNEEAEKSKMKIDILGQSLRGSLTLMITALVELSLVVYLLAYLLQIRTLLPSHRAAISASPFFGVMVSGLGRAVVLLTILGPFGVCIFVLGHVFPSVRAEWSGPEWIASWPSRWILILAFAVTDALVIVNLRRINAVLLSPEVEASGLDS